MAITPLTVSQLTTTDIKGPGVIDVLMRSVGAHLDKEFLAQRIRGPEYSVVYLGALESVMKTALQLILDGRKADLEAQLLEKQLLIADSQLAKAAVDLQKSVIEKELLEASKPKIAAEIAEINQKILQSQAQVAMINQQRENAVVEKAVLVAQECKLRAEFNLTEQATLTKAQEAQLMLQKVATERAQTSSVGVTEDSIIGRQKMLYVKQAAGFDRDAEQKATKILVDTWNVRRTTDEGTAADGVNNLSDAVIGSFIAKLKAGINA